MAPSFPLSRLLLPKVHVTPEEHRLAKEMMNRMLEHTVQAFENFAYDAQGVVDLARWKPLGAQDDLKLYRERVAGATSSGLAAALGPDSMLPNSDSVAALASPTMMMTGCCPGSVANAMSAAISETQDDLSLLVSFMHEDVADCAVLKTLESPTPQKPYHYLGYKYFVRKSPGAPGLVKHRDSLYLEFSGTTMTKEGELLGFVLLHSVNLPEFPDLSSYNCIRALQSVRYLYRQRSREVVEVFMLGNLDVSGMVIKPIADKLAQITLFALVQLTDCAEAKKLTHMVQERRPSVLVRSRQVGSEGCQLCGKTPKSALLSSGSKLLLKCEVCGCFACANCRDTKRIYVPNPDHILGKFQKVSVCMTCIIEANDTLHQPSSKGSSEPTPRQPTIIWTPASDAQQRAKSGSSGGSSHRSVSSDNADPLSARSDKSVSAAVASVSAAVANMEISATRAKSSSYSSNSSAGSYSSALESTPTGRSSPNAFASTLTLSPARRNQTARGYSGNCRSGSRGRSQRLARERPSPTHDGAVVSPIRPREMQSNVASPKQLVVRANTAGKPPVPSPSMSPQHSQRTASSNRSSRSHSAGTSTGCSPQDAMYARLMELNDVAEQTSAYVTSRGRRMS